MIDFKNEIGKYEYILTVEEVAKQVSVENEQNDFIKILETINNNLENSKNNNNANTDKIND